MKSLSIKAVIICDAEGNYIIHGCNDQTAQQMFTALGPLWPLDPSRETVHYIEIPVNVPDYEDVMKTEYVNTPS